MSHSLDMAFQVRRLGIENYSSRWFLYLLSSVEQFHEFFFFFLTGKGESHGHSLDLTSGGVM